MNDANVVRTIENPELIIVIFGNLTRTSKSVKTFSQTNAQKKLRPCCDTKIKGGGLLPVHYTGFPRTNTSLLVEDSIVPPSLHLSVRFYPWQI